MNHRTSLSAAVLALLAASSQAQTAGTVAFLQGDVGIRTAQGQLRAAERGASVEAGDTVETGGTGRAQLRMTDGAYISLQPQTALRLDAYRTASATQTESGVLSLLRGGLRTITGLIGRTERQNYQLNTPTATVGIRGTEFLATADEGTRVRVAGGAVALCTSGGGCLTIPAGQTGFVPNSNSTPVIVAAAPSLPPNPAPQEGVGFVQAEQRDGDGRIAVIARDARQPTPEPAPVTPPEVTPPVVTPPVVTPPTYNQPMANGAGGFIPAVARPAYPFDEGVLGGTMTFNAQGGLTSYTDSSQPSFTVTPGTVVEANSDGFIAWGRWTSGNYNNPNQSNSPIRSLHYIAVSNSTQPTGVVSGTFTTFASTAPTLTSSSSALVLATGTPNSVTGSITLNNFSVSGGGTGNYVLNIPIASQTYAVQANLSQLFTGWAFLDTNGSLVITGTGCPCSGAVPYAGALAGAISGDGANRRVGTSYGFSTSGGIVSGAVVFK